MAIFDAHLHIINPEYPLYSNQGFLPDPYLLETYLKDVEALNVSAGAIVSGSFQQFDQSYLINSLGQLREKGKSFVGVTQLPYSVSDEQLYDLDEKGVRAVRFNLFRGGSESKKHLLNFSQRVYDLLGWHVELYIGYESLVELESVIAKLPKVSIDHLGLEKRSQSSVLSLIEKGCKLKATGFGRLDFDALEFMGRVQKENPNALMFGSDLPSTRAKRPFEHNDLFSIYQYFSNDDAEKICLTNSMTFYGLQQA